MCETCCRFDVLDLLHTVQCIVCSHYIAAHSLSWLIIKKTCVRSVFQHGSYCMILANLILTVFKVFVVLSANLLTITQSLAMIELRFAASDGSGLKELLVGVCRFKLALWFEVQFWTIACLRHVLKQTILIFAENVNRQIVLIFLKTKRCPKMVLAIARIWIFSGNLAEKFHLLASSEEEISLVFLSEEYSWKISSKVHHSCRFLT